MIYSVLCCRPEALWRGKGEGGRGEGGREGLQSGEAKIRAEETLNHSTKYIDITIITAHHKKHVGIGWRMWDGGMDCSRFEAVKNPVFKLGMMCRGMSSTPLTACCSTAH